MTRIIKTELWCLTGKQYGIMPETIGEDRQQLGMLLSDRKINGHAVQGEHIAPVELHIQWTGWAGDREVVGVWRAAPLCDCGAPEGTIFRETCDVCARQYLDRHPEGCQ